VEGRKERKGEDDVEVKKELQVEGKKKVKLQVVLPVAISRLLLTLYDVGKGKDCFSGGTAAAE
jgi:hypothetical protein